MNTFTFRYSYYGKEDVVDVTVPGGKLQARQEFNKYISNGHWIQSVKILEIICPEKDYRRNA